MNVFGTVCTYAGVLGTGYTVYLVGKSSSYTHRPYCLFKK